MVGECAAQRIHDRLVTAQVRCRPLLPSRCYTPGVQHLRSRLFQVEQTWRPFTPKDRIAW